MRRIASGSGYRSNALPLPLTSKIDGDPIANPRLDISRGYRNIHTIIGMDTAMMSANSVASIMHR